jgi:hypothetical protein
VWSGILAAGCVVHKVDHGENTMASTIDRAGAGIVLASLGTGVAAVCVSELGEHPGAVDGPDPRLGQVDRGVRVTVKMRLHLGFQLLDVLVNVISTAGPARAQAPHA